MRVARHTGLAGEKVTDSVARTVALVLAAFGCSPGIGAVASHTTGVPGGHAVATHTPAGTSAPDGGAGGASSARPDAGSLRTVDKADAWIAAKSRFKPPDDEFPQIIQRSDFETIEAIEALYVELERIDGVSRAYEVGEEQPLSVTAQSDEILFRGRQDVTSVRITSDRAFLAGKHLNPTTAELFATLQRVLVSLANDFRATGVRATRYGARSYRSITRIEFAFPPLVVQLEAMSNGRGNPEHLYVLNVDRVAESFLWRNQDFP